MTTNKPYFNFVHLFHTNKEKSTNTYINNTDFDISHSSEEIERKRETDNKQRNKNSNLQLNELTTRIFF